MLHDGKNALVVDPGEAQPVFDALQMEGLQLQGILVTHHHADHTEGIDALREASGAPVFGPARESMPEPINRMVNGDCVRILNLNFNVLDVPGHTAGHIAFYCPTAEGNPILFCGDTLFSAGCGRLFEGTASQMQTSLQLLAQLPGSTRVCCAHEYTMANLQFAMEVEPDNDRLISYHRDCQELRMRGLPTLPSNIALERQINPFLRLEKTSIVQSIGRFDPTGCLQNGAFATLRQWKNQYR